MPGARVGPANATMTATSFGWLSPPIIIYMGFYAAVVGLVIWLLVSGVPDRWVWGSILLLGFPIAAPIIFAGFGWLVSDFQITGKELSYRTWGGRRTHRIPVSSLKLPPTPYGPFGGILLIQASVTGSSRAEKQFGLILDRRQYAMVLSSESLSQLSPPTGG